MQPIDAPSSRRHSGPSSSTGVWRRFGWLPNAACVGECSCLVARTPRRARTELAAHQRRPLTTKASCQPAGSSDLEHATTSGPQRVGLGLPKLRAGVRSVTQPAGTDVLDHRLIVPNR